MFCGRGGEGAFVAWPMVCAAAPPMCNACQSPWLRSRTPPRPPYAAPPSSAPTSMPPPSTPPRPNRPPAQTAPTPPAPSCKHVREASSHHKQKDTVLKTGWLSYDDTTQPPPQSQTALTPPLPPLRQLPVHLRHQGIRRGHALRRRQRVLLLLLRRARLGHLLQQIPPALVTEVTVAQLPSYHDHAYRDCKPRIAMAPAKRRNTSSPRTVPCRHDPGPRGPPLPPPRSTPTTTTTPAATNPAGTSASAWRGHEGAP